MALGSQPQVSCNGKDEVDHLHPYCDSGLKLNNTNCYEIVSIEI
jgi:hypothetical protein